MQYTVKLRTHNQHLEYLESELEQLKFVYTSELFPDEKEYDSAIIIYCDNKPQQDEAFVILNSKFSDISKIEKYALEDVDWQEAWKSHFEPIRVGKLAVTISEDDFIASDEVRVLIDPGMAFGNGGHPTTKGCLFFLEKLVSANMKVLDFGTGSGILAIASAKFGATEIDAVDNDPIAIPVCEKNALINNEKKINFMTSDEFEIQQDYNLIVANITADVLIEFFEYLTKKQQKLKIMILSGISDYRKAQMDIFLNAEGISVSDVFTENGWYTYLISL